MLKVNDFILIGDPHFGEKNFDKDFFIKNQVRLFKEQIVPYMKQHNIKHIISTGDFFHNRTNIDISFFDTLCTELLDYLHDELIDITNILGNHDIYYKSSKETNMLKYIERLYDNFSNVQKQSVLMVGDKKVLLVPWLLENETIKYNNEDIIVGHFEIKNFELSRGSIDTKSTLNQDDFKQYERVYSGHYHINQQRGNIKYVGTPYQINWGDFGNTNGFYHITEDDDVFIPNTVSETHLKLFWDEKHTDILTYCINGDTRVKISLNDIDSFLENRFVVKVYNYYSENNSFEELLFKLREKNIKYTFYNEQELDTIINPENKSVKIKNTDSFVLDYVKEKHPELTPILEDILKNVGENQ